MSKVSVTRLFVIVALYSLFANFAHPITPTVIQNLGLHDYMFGVAFAAMAVTNFLFSPFWGKMAQTIGCAKMAAVCFVGYGVGQAFFGVATTELGIIIGRLISGFFIGGISVFQLLYVMENSTLENRGKNLAVVATIGSVVSPFGYLIGGFLGDISISLTFVIQVITLVGAGVLILLVLKDAPQERSAVSFGKMIAEANPFRVVWQSISKLNAYLLVFFAIALVTSFATTSFEQCFNYFIKDQLGFPPSYNGLLKAVVGFITLLSNATICMWILRKTNVQKSLVGLLFVCTTIMGGIILAEQPSMFIVLSIASFAGNAIYLPMIQELLTRDAKGDNGVLVGFYNSMRSLGMIFGSLFAGFIYATGPRMSFVYAAAAFGLATFLAFLNYKQAKRKTISA